uniref:FG-GAP-like repeat-containing protein n=1 Tax=Cesiribacter sp. SM1 TaxID=2861196 RepID=UPI001CD69A21
NGAVYADLDGDGDLDLVVNNINKPAFIYENRASEQRSHHHYLQLQLKGAGANTAGIGAKVQLWAKGKQQYQEQMPNRGYQSSVSPLLHFGLGSEAAVDSLRIIWPTGKTQLLEAVKANQLLVLEEQHASATYRYPKASPAALQQVASPIAYAQAKSNINDFKRQPLLVNPLSFSGPCMVKADVDADGLEDVLIGGAAGQAAKLYLQQKGGSFKEKAVAAFAEDAGSEDTDAVFFDANADGRQDLYISSGGYGNFMPEDKLLQDRLYLGDGRGGFVKADALPPMLTSTSVVRAADLNGDGREDLFVGGRVIPGRYPEAPRSYVLINEGSGTAVKFSDRTAAVAPQLQQPGMVTDAAFHDLNGDGAKELIVVGEWMPLQVYSSKEGKLTDDTQSYFEKRYTGWWNKLLVGDFNADGKADLLIGNMGENTQVKVQEGQPAELYYKDFDENGSVDPILCFYIQGSSYPYVTRDELLDQISMLRTRFTSYESYADATIGSIFSQQEMKDVGRLSANYLKTAYFEGTGAKFREKELPLEVQYSPVYAMAVTDYNGDGRQDVVLGGNIHEARLRFGRYDASYGMLLQGDGKGGFSYVPQRESGLKIKGDIRSILSINNTLLFGINQQSIKAYKVKKPVVNQ